jgi:hypothetical protein
MKKYELQPTGLTTPGGKPLFLVVALRDFGGVRKGDLGGYIESTDNLSNEGNCWVFGNARVSGKARVSDDARVSGDARVSDYVEIYDTTKLTGSEKPKTCHGEQTGKFCSECGEKL